MFAAGKTAAVAGVAGPDDKFNYVTMLLHGDGTNGAQNNTFLDSSTNNYTITRNGNTTQGSFSPYGSNWSNYFNGTSTLSLADNAVFTLPADFTIEFWFFQTGAFQDRLIIDKWTEYYVYTRANGVIGLAWGPYNASGMFGVGGIVQSGNGGFALNTWTHVAAVRNSNTFTLYINGVSVSTATNSATVTDTSAGITIGDYGGGGGYAFEGYVSNARIVKGTAVYTANFTPSTTPLTAISGTSLLTCQSNRFIDNSTNAFAITANGSPSVQRFNPFGTSTAYSTSVIGGSGYFDGSGDYLTVADNAALDVDAGSFTMEAWVYLTDATVTSPILAKNFGSAGGWMFWVQSTLRLRMYDASAGQVTATSSASLISNSWNHVAATRSSNTLTVYVNGVSSGTATFTGTSTNAAVLEIGGYGAATAVSTGYISDARLVKGSVVYTGNFTPPTAPLTAITNTSLLTNFTNGAIIDNAMMNDLETVGNAQISTSVKKYGTGSLAFDGTGDWLAVPTSQNFAPGVGDWTIECWLYPISGNWAIVTGSNFYINNNSGTVYVGDASVDIIAVSPPSTGVWTHIAVTKSGSTVRLFYDGTQVGSSTTALSTAITTSMIVGGRPSSSISTNGYIDDLRITKGYARYTATFTPPTAALSDTGPY